METVKMTYQVISNGNQYAQKTVSVTVSNNSNAFTQFEEEVRSKLGENIRFNHAGKIVILND
jgi:serine acetyltransferase